ncbi:MAG: hypothetical protein ABIG66_02765 [Candidatus Kerfeldbacteria bacterium]
MEKHLGTITILIEDRQKNARAVNDMLTDNGHLIVARLGANVQPKCMEQCTGMIIVATEGTTEEINAFGEALDTLEGTTVKTCIVTE